MNWIRKILPKSLPLRVYSLVIGFMVLLAVYFTVSGYYSTIAHKTDDNLKILQGIANTASNFIQGDSLEALMAQYQKKDELHYSKSDLRYYQIHQMLSQLYQANGLKSPIYTLQLQSDSAHTYFEFGVTSSENPYFRHVYNSHPSGLLEAYWKGGVLPPYTDGHGTWLSAAAPIRNSKGEVVSAVMVDREFDDFNQEANMVLMRGIVVALLALVLLMSVLYPLLNSVFESEAKAKEALQSASLQLERKNKSLTDSIQYAQRIQYALTQDNRRNLERLPKHFHLYLPRDIVSGDFFWTSYSPDRNRLYLANADCTGHGVPGALMSILGITSLRELVEEGGLETPCKILTHLDSKIRRLLHQEEISRDLRVADGMDIGLCVIDFDRKEVLFSGAHSPLIAVKGGKATLYKGDRLAIGGDASEKSFHTEKLALEDGLRLYMYSDGYVDQFGGTGEKSEKFSRKRLLKILEEMCSLPLPEQEDALYQTFEVWRGRERQLDDVSVVGLEL